MVILGALLWLLFGCAYAVVIVLVFFAHRWAESRRPGGWVSMLLLSLAVGLVLAPLGWPVLWERIPVTVNGTEAFSKPQIVSHFGVAYGVAFLAAMLAAFGVIRLLRRRQTNG